ncbi:NAD-dependent epimerase/dehydratase-like protein, partial [Aureobasidium melanogenum]
MSNKTSTNLPDILLIGATGRTGRLVLDSALKRGHKVVALIRPSSSLSPQANLTISRGSPLEPAAITTALSHTTGSVVIISTLGQTRKSGNPFAATTSPPLLMSHSASAVVQAAKAPGSRVQKFILMSMFGTGSSFDNLNCLMRATMLYSNMKQSLDDQNAVDHIVKNSGLTFVMPRPAMLKGEVALPVKSLGDAGEKAGFMPSVSAQSCAEFMLDAAVSAEWDGRTPVLSN